jgi:hypothetical protein
VNLHGYVDPIPYLAANAPASGGGLADGTLVSYQSDVYRMAGGAPLYVSDWAAVGGPQPTTTLSAAQWASLRSYPADGTLLGASGGGVFIVAGGAPLYLSSWSVIGGPKPSVAIDQWDIDHTENPAAHLRSYPADGTLLRSGPSGSDYVITSGVATFHGPATTGDVVIDPAVLVNAGQAPPWNHLLAPAPSGGGGVPGGGGDAGGASQLVSLVPGRLLDTRSGYSTVDGAFAGGGVRASASVTELTVAGRAGVPRDAAAVVLNVAAVDARTAGFVTVFPCGADRPNASNLNYTAGSVLSNLVIAKVGTDGNVCLYASGATDLVVDVNGYATGTSAFVGLVPGRLMETRPSASTVDGQMAGIGVRGAASVTELQVAGRAGVPTDASAAVLNVTVTEAAADGFITVFPCGTDRPNASNLNYLADQTIPNAVVAKIGADGKVCIFSYATAHVVVDVNGYFPAAATLTPIVPARLVETRDGLATVDGLANGIGLRAAGSLTEVQVTGRAGIPMSATAAVLNVTAISARAPGYITVFPCGTDRPNAANLNYTAGQIVPNAVFAKLDSDGKVCVYTYAEVDLAVDVAAYST